MPEPAIIWGCNHTAKARSSKGRSFNGMVSWVEYELGTIKWVNTHLSGSIHSARFMEKDPFLLCRTQDAMDAPRSWNHRQARDLVK